MSRIAYKIALQIRDAEAAEERLRNIAESCGPTGRQDYIDAADLVRRAHGEQAARTRERLETLRARQAPKPEAVVAWAS